jgi:diguanylate cyclase (GGDEF)-like protein
MSIVKDQQGFLSQKINSHRQLVDNSYELAVLDTEKKLTDFAFKLISNSAIVDAFEAHNRSSLYSLAIPCFNEAHAHGDIDLAGFIQSDGRHFLRLTDPNKFGDDIANKRPMIALALLKKQPITSMDVTLYNISFVSIVPIFKKGKFLGILQISSKIQRFQNRLNLHSGIKSALAFDSKKIDTFLPTNSFKDYGPYSIISSNDSLFKYLPSTYAFPESLKYTIKDKTFILLAKDLTTYSNTPLGKIICAVDITKDELDYKNKILQLTIITIILIIVAFFILNIGFTRLIRRINEDIKIKEELNQQLSHQLYIDHLTGHPNRHALLRDLQKESFYAIILLNINNFKEINDFYGHEIGDQVITSISKTIQDQIRNYPMHLYKMPSDEYAIALLEPMSAHECESLSQSILSNIHTMHYDFSGIHIHITLTMGINMFLHSSHSNDSSALLINADMALKEAKKRHKSHLTYNENMQIKQEYQNNILWSKKVSDAIEEDRFCLYYQSIYDDTGKIVEYEALIRLIEPDNTVVSPYYFLQAAKRSNLYAHLTKFVISTAFSFIEATQNSVSINFSVDDILDTPTREFLLYKLQHSKHSNQIVIELLESDGIDNYTDVSSFIKEVKEYGVRIAIDDFGTGYSNFAHILRLNVDFLKIDGSLIKDLDTDRNAQTIVKAIVHFSKQLGIKTIAEFIHTQSVYAMCRELNVDYFQGYYLSEPKPMKELNI